MKRNIKPTEGQIRATKQAAKTVRGIELSEAEALKHAQAIIRNGFEDDEFGQGFWDRAKEYFAN